LEPDSAGVDAFVFEFADDCLEQTGGVTEWLEPMLASDGGEISGGGGFHVSC